MQNVGGSRVVWVVDGGHLTSSILLWKWVYARTEFTIKFLLFINFEMLSNFQNFRFEDFIFLILGEFNAFKFKLESYLWIISIRIC